MKATGKASVFSDSEFKDIGLAPELIAAAQGPGWGPKCTFVQQKAIPLLLDKAKDNLIAQAPSGNGKTATFTLALLQLIGGNSTNLEWRKQCPQALVVSHNKALTEQTCSEINKVIQAGRFSQKGLLPALQIVSPHGYDEGQPLPPNAVLGKSPLVGTDGGPIKNQVICGPPKQVMKLTARGGGKDIRCADPALMFA